MNVILVDQTRIDQNSVIANFTDNNTIKNCWCPNKSFKSFVSSERCQQSCVFVTVKYRWQLWRLFSTKKQLCSFPFNNRPVCGVTDQTPSVIFKTSLVGFWSGPSVVSSTWFRADLWLREPSQKHSWNRLSSEPFPFILEVLSPNNAVQSNPQEKTIPRAPVLRLVQFPASARTEASQTVNYRIHRRYLHDQTGTYILAPDKKFNWKHRDSLENPVYFYKQI